MNFLDQLIDPLLSARISWGSLQMVEVLLSDANLYSDEKLVYERRMMEARTQEEIDKLIQELIHLQPIMGLERFPTNVGDAAKATKIRVEREDFKERKWTEL
jgi:hypothetical protein